MKTMMTETTPDSTQFVIPLIDNIENELYSKHMLMEMFITHMLDYGYEKPEIKAMLEYALAHPSYWLSTKELNERLISYPGSRFV